MANAEFTNFITKALTTEEIDNRRIVKGHITAEIVDRQNEFVAIEEVLAIMKNYMDLPLLSDWHSNRMVGKVLSYEKSEIDGHPSIYVTAEVFKKEGVTLYDHVWDKVVKRIYKGFSMGGGSRVREPIVKDGKLAFNLREIELYEIALCPSPANPLAIIDHVNDFAKAANLGVIENDGKCRIQCSGIICEITKDHTNPTTAIDSDNDTDKDHTGADTENEKKRIKVAEEVNKSEYTLNVKVNLEPIEKQVKEIIEREHELLGHSPDKKEEKVHKKLEQEFKKEDNINVSEQNSNVYKALPETLINNMSSVEQTQTQPTTAAPASAPAAMVKDNSSEIALLTTLAKNHDAVIGTLTTSIAEIQKSVAATLEAIQKGQDRNPVASAPTVDLKPSVSDPKDAGASTEAAKGIAPEGDAQASIIAPAGEPSGTGTVQKSDSKPEEKKPAEMKKSDGFVYEFVKAERPKTPSVMPDTPQGAPTAYQIMKAINSGFGGKHTDYAQSFIEGWTRLLKGEFGSGFPGGN